MNFATLLRIIVVGGVFALAFFVSCVTGVAFFWSADTYWPLLYVLGLPLAAAVWADQRWFR